MSTHWKLANTPCTQLSRDEVSLAVAELQLCSLPSSLEYNRSLYETRLGAVHAALARIQVPMSRTAKKLVAEFVASLARQSVAKPGEPVIPVQEFLRLLSQLKSLHRMWRSAVMARSADTSSGSKKKFFADDLAEALEAFCEPGETRVCLPLVELAVNTAFGTEVIQTSDSASGSPLSSPLAGESMTDFAAVGSMDVASLCHVLLNGDFVTELNTADNEVDDIDTLPTSVPPTNFRTTGGHAAHARLSTDDERIDLAELRSAALRSQQEEQERKMRSSNTPQHAAPHHDKSELKAIHLGAAGHIPPPQPEPGLLLAMSMDVPKCPKNLRLGPDAESDSDESLSARKSSRRLSKSKLSARFRAAAYTALNHVRSNSLPCTPPLSAHGAGGSRGVGGGHEGTLHHLQQHSTSSAAHQQASSPSPLPPRPHTRSGSSSAKRRPATLTHRRSVSPAVGVLLPSLAHHAALASPLYERCRKTFPKKTIQFR
jgi:hypothetical protein